MKRIRTGMALLALVAVALFSAGGTAHAVLQDVSRATPGGPVAVDAVNGFPLWYIDTNGRALEQCNFSAAVQDAFCIPAGPAAVPAGGIDFNEAFYANASVTIPDQGNISRALYEAALEAAFASADGEPAAGQQVVFTRIRIRADVALAGTYTVTHPFGQKSYTVAAGPRAINDTVDIPAGIPLDFVSAVTGGNIGPFLQCIGAPLTNPANPGALYLGNVNVPCAIIGPLGIHSVSISGPGTDTSTADFFISGRISPDVVPTPITITGATFRCTLRTCFLNFTAISDPTATVTVTTVPAGALTLPLAGDPAGSFSGQASVRPANRPSHVSFGATMVGRFNSAAQTQLVDQVTITEASFNSATGILSIKATSGDAAATLTATQFGPMPRGNVFVDLNGASPAPVTPPVQITVASSSGGAAAANVSVVNIPETLRATTKVYLIAERRYRISGTSSAPGAAVTVRLVGGVNDGQIVGTAFVNAAGRWRINRTVAQGAPAPKRTNRISITSSGNASRPSAVLNKL